VFAVAGCAAFGPQKEKVAIYWKSGDRFVIEVAAKVKTHGHDLIDVVRYGTDRETEQFDLPRVEGKIDGAEIHHKAGTYPYVGSITIRDGQMTIDLSWDKYDLKRIEHAYWSGRYVLVEKKG
jgi:hypothetical protein